MSQQWIPVFSGSIPEAIVMQSVLEARGIPTYVPDSNIKGIDPFITGAGCLTSTVMVPEDRAEEAAREIARAPEEDGDPGEWERGLEPGWESNPADDPDTVELEVASEDSADDGAADAPTTSSARDELAAHGRRMMWCAILPFIAPLGLFLAVDYFRDARRLRPRPAGYGTAVVATTLCVVWTAGLFLAPALLMSSALVLG